VIKVGAATEVELKKKPHRGRVSATRAAIEEASFRRRSALVHAAAVRGWPRLTGTRRSA